MATVESVVSGARTYLRDHPRYFTGTVTKNDASRTFELPYKNVTPMGLFVYGGDGTTNYTGGYSVSNWTPSPSAFGYVLDEREGLLRIANQPASPGSLNGIAINVEGYRYEWVADVDMRYFANVVIAKHAYHVTGFCMNDVSDQEEDVMSLGAAVEASISLLAEYSRDVDLSTPEGVALPVSQRYRQVESWLLGPNGLLSRYNTMAAMLDVGLERIEVGTLRRVSRTTNRFVPVYRPREYDDAHRPQRVFPPVDPIAPSTPQPGFIPAPYVYAVTEDEETMFYGTDPGSPVP